MLQVTLTNDQTIDSLKDVIKQKNANNLKEIDAKELTLYQVFILDNDHLGGKLSSMNFDTNILLWSMQKLSAIFPTGAEEGHLHICRHVETRCMLVLFTLQFSSTILCDCFITQQVLQVHHKHMNHPISSVNTHSSLTYIDHSNKWSPKWYCLSITVPF